MIANTVYDSGATSKPAAAALQGSVLVVGEIIVGMLGVFIPVMAYNVRIIPQNSAHQHKLRCRLQPQDDTVLRRLR